MAVPGLDVIYRHLSNLPRGLGENKNDYRRSQQAVKLGNISSVCTAVFDLLFLIRKLGKN